MILSPYLSRILRASVREIVAEADATITLLPQGNIPEDEFEDLIVSAWEQAETLGYTIRRLRKDNPISTVMARIDLIEDARLASQQVASTCAELSLELEAELAFRASRQKGGI